MTIAVALSQERDAMCNVLENLFRLLVNHYLRQCIEYYPTRSESIQKCDVHNVHTQTEEIDIFFRSVSSPSIMINSYDHYNTV